VVLVGCGPSEADRELFDASDGNIEAVKQHLAAGADVNAKGDAGMTPLNVAALEGQKEIVELLIANGADVNTKNSVGGTPLHQAAVADRNEVAELLITEGADVNAKDDWYGRTPLQFAAEGGNKEIVELLIAKGADVNAKDKNGKTPLDLAIMWKRTETADLLRKHGGKTGEELKAEGK